MTIDPELKNQIRRLFYGDHFPINAICESLGVHHETVKRAINQENFHKPRNSTQQILQYHHIIEDRLKLYPKLRSTKIHRILIDHGFNGSVETVRKYVRQLRPGIREAFIERIILPAGESQVDWAHFGTLTIGNCLRKLYAFVMVLAFSRMVFVRFTLDMKTSTFLRCHVEAFKFFKGVCRILLYDNLKSAVIERQGKAIRFNEDMVSFSGHYCFEPRACRPFRGNEKGRVERNIRYIRESFFEGYTVGSLASLNHDIDKWRDLIANVRAWPDNKDFTVIEKYEEEVDKLISLPASEPITYEEVSTSSGKTPYIRFDLNRYSIPPEYVRQPLILLADENKIKILCQNKVIAEHERSWDRDKRVENPAHIDALLARKKSGLAASVANDLFIEIPEAQDLLVILADRGEKITRAVNLLNELRQHYGAEKLQLAIREALKRETPRPESVAYILNQTDQVGPSIPPSLPKRKDVRDLTIKSHNPEIYDKL